MVKRLRHRPFTAVTAVSYTHLEMWLTHYSPSLIRPDEYMDMVRDIFPKAYPGKDGKTVEMNFEED